jgi:hypothetical protein
VSVTVLAPSRGRPERARQMYATFRATAEKPDTRLVLVIDRDDPAFRDYLDLPLPRERRRFGWAPDELWILALDTDQSGDLVKATNAVAPSFTKRVDIIGHVGDDHRFRSVGWDVRVMGALDSPGIAYGDDLLQRERLPTAPFISSAIVEALGWYALPACRHMFIDDAWKRLGDELGILHYLPDVVIEHEHPGAGKVASDAGYERVDAFTDADRGAYERWLDEGLAADVARVRQALAVAA